MTVSDFIKTLIKTRRISQAKLGQQVSGISQQAVADKLKLDTWQVYDVVKYADALEYDIQITAIDRQNGQRITIDIPMQPTKQD